MADDEASVVENVVSEEVQKLKIPDLKEKLKSLGLPITGNKIELMERLQSAHISGKDLSASSETEGISAFAAELAEPLPEFEDEGKHPEDDISLLDNDQFPFSSESDSMKVVDHSVVDSKLNLGTSAAKPLKKRIVAKTNEGTVTAKKLQLNRTNVITSTFLNSKPVSPVKAKIVITDKKIQADGKKILSIKSMTDSERLAMRAKRFNVSPSGISLSKSEISFGTSGTLASTSTSADLEVLKKRAERFGQNVSTVMRQIEEKEKLLKRKFKFGASVSLSATSALDEEEKKRRRADRFGIS